MTSHLRSILFLMSKRNSAEIIFFKFCRHKFCCLLFWHLRSPNAFGRLCANICLAEEPVGKNRSVMQEFTVLAALSAVGLISLASTKSVTSETSDILS